MGVVDHKMRIPEYKFRRECPKCDNPSIPRVFIPTEGEKVEYLDCKCDICGFKCTIQTLESVFEKMSLLMKVEK